jgi:hypothetical protein
VSWKTIIELCVERYELLNVQRSSRMNPPALSSCPPYPVVWLSAMNVQRLRFAVEPPFTTFSAWPKSTQLAVSVPLFNSTTGG